MAALTAPTALICDHGLLYTLDVETCGLICDHERSKK